MSYQVLARKWRPHDFESMVGQEHVVAALKHALDENRLHHAYLFTGTRGVGKTTLSRILAKCLNCVGEDGKGGVTKYGYSSSASLRPERNFKDGRIAARYSGRVSGQERAPAARICDRQMSDSVSERDTHRGLRREPGMKQSGNTGTLVFDMERDHIKDVFYLNRNLIQKGDDSMCQKCKGKYYISQFAAFL